MYKQLIWISPTSLENFISCKARWQFTQDSNYKKLRRISDRAAVGLVVHSAIELLYAGKSFDAAWSIAVSSIENTMQEEWEPALIPRPESWAGYQVNKARLAVRASKGEFGSVSSGHKLGVGSAQRKNSNQVDFASELANIPFPWVERKLFDRGLGLVGIPDLVRMDGEDLIVVDHKSGLNQAHPTESQRRQLMFYAWLVYVNYGVFPKRVEILTTQNAPYAIEVNESDVRKVVDLAIETRRLMESDSEAKLNVLEASPSESNCSWCSFKVVCPAFIDECKQEWNTNRVLVGQVVRLENISNKYTLEIDVESPEWMSSPMTIVNLSTARPPRLGERISLSNFRERNGSCAANWNTLVYQWD